MKTNIKYTAVFIMAFFFFNISSTFAQSKKGNIKKESYNTKTLDSLYTQGQIAFSLEKYEDAYNLFNEILEKEPKYADVYEELAILEASIENYPKALEYIEKAYIAFPDNTHLLAMKGEVLSKLERNQDAGEAYEQYAILKTGEEKTEGYKNALKFYLHAEDFEKSLEIIDILEQQNLPKNEELDIAVQKITVYVEQNEKNLAIQSVNQIIEEFKDQEKFINDYILFKEIKTFIYGKFEDSLQLKNTYKEYLHERPVHEDFFKWTLKNLKKTGEVDYVDSFSKAFIIDETYEEEQRILPIYAFIEMEGIDNSPIAQELLSIALDEKHVTSSAALLQAQIFTSKLNDQLDTDTKEQYTQEAKKWFNKAITLNPENLDAYIHYMEFLLGEEDSEKELNQVLEQLKNQKNIEKGFYYFYKGVKEVSEEKHKDAIKTFNKGLEVENKSITHPYQENLKRLFYLNLGFLHYEIKDYDKAEVYYNAYIEEDPYNLAVLNNLSYLLAELDKDLEKAAEMSMFTVENEPDNPIYLDTYAWILYKKGDYVQAKNILDHAISLLNPDHPTSYVYYSHLAEIENALGNHKKAINLYNRALELGADAKEIKAKLKKIKK